MQKPIVGIIMGSSSDAAIMRPAAELLDTFSVSYEFTVVSAHRSPELMFEYAVNAMDRGMKIIIAGAGGAAHLPGMVAAITTLPVIGVPVRSKNSLDGWDSLLSIVQMPESVPVATMAVNAAYNAGLLAVQMLAIHDTALMEKLKQLKWQNIEKVRKQQNELKMP